MRSKETVLWTNTAFLGIIGKDGEEPFDRAWDAFCASLVLDEATAGFMEALDTRRPWRGRLQCADRLTLHSRVFDLSLTPFEVDEGGVVMSLTVREVTEEVMAERRIVTAQKMEALGTLAAGIAHDFNNILMIMLGYTELATGDLSPSSPAIAFLEEVTKAGMRAKDLISQILSFCRETPGVRVPLQLSTIVKEQVKFLRQVVPADVELVSALSVTAGESGVVYGSPVEIQQVMMNLVVNAVQAMSGRGRVTVSLTRKTGNDSRRRGVVVLEPSPSHGGYLALSVRDEGVGIEPAFIYRIFDPGFTTKPPGMGTGMGLAVVYAIVKRLGGGIVVESSCGRGTAVTVLFPCKGSDTFTDDGVDLSWVREVRPHAPFRPLSVLVVDDEESVLSLLREVLQKRGWAVQTFSDPREALEHFRHYASLYHAAVLDVQMPHISGLDLAGEFFVVRRDTPVVCISGYVDEKVVAHLKNLGVREVVAKPVSPEKLVDLILSIYGEYRHVNVLAQERL